MLLVGLTGGIGSGKSTVAAALVERGAVLIDADAIVRELQAPGAPMLATLAERFGASIIRADGSLDREALAAVAFADAESVKAINAIVHPAVLAEMAERVAAQAGSDNVVVMDIPLLKERREGMEAVIVVDVPVDVAVERLVAQRGFSEADARARIAQQMTRDERLAIADYVIDNAGDREALDAQIESLWGELALRATGHP